MFQKFGHGLLVGLDVAVIYLVPLGFVGRPGLVGMGSTSLAVDRHMSGHGILPLGLISWTIVSPTGPLGAGSFQRFIPYRQIRVFPEVL